MFLVFLSFVFAHNYLPVLHGDSAFEIEYVKNNPQNLEAKESLQRSIAKYYVDRKIIKPYLNELKNTNETTRAIGDTVEKISGKGVEAEIPLFKTKTKADLFKGEYKILFIQPHTDSELKISYEDNDQWISIAKEIDLGLVLDCEVGLKNGDTFGSKISSNFHNFQLSIDSEFSNKRNQEYLIEYKILW